MKIALVGIGGFGRIHTGVILQLISKQLATLTAFAEINPAAHPDAFEQLSALGAKHYEDYEEMLRCHPEVDIVVIPTPIPLHAPMSTYAMEQGFHVILEKPPAVTIQDMDAIIETQQRTGKLCQVNFQNTSGTAFRDCMQKLQESSIGRLERVTGVGLWKRTRSYYERTPWAGKIIHNGAYVLDGTVNNPLAHLLNNCLIAAGYGDSKLATPVSVQAECYKGHQIESEDTVSARIETANGVQVNFYTTLCNEEQHIPYIILKGENGRMRWTYDHRLTIENEQGVEEIVYEDEELIVNMYMNMFETIQGRAKLLSGADTCRSFVLAANGIFESSAGTHAIAPEYITVTPENNTEAVVIPNFEQLVAKAVDSGKLYSELGVEWAVKTKPFSLENYEQFRMFK